MHPDIVTTILYDSHVDTYVRRHQFIHSRILITLFVPTQLQDAFAGLLSEAREDELVFRIHNLRDIQPSGTHIHPDERAQLCASDVSNYMRTLQPLMHGVIWQKDVFQIRAIAGEEWDTTINRGPNTNANPHRCPRLGGELRFGDNIEDEWFSVALLCELTRLNADIVVTARDTDGEFLLIETAAALPDWLTPDTCDNRVFIHQGVLHIIPQTLTTNEHLSLDEGLELVFSHPERTQASSQAQAIFNTRVIMAMHTAHTSNHVAHTIIPAGVAAILDCEPQLVAAAVEAIYSRDPIEMRVCKKMETFSPLASVAHIVLFSRCLYAQLNHIEFALPKVFGPEPRHNTKEHVPFIIGAKLACGFEILADRERRLRKKQDKQTGTSANTKTDRGSADTGTDFREGAYGDELGDALGVGGGESTQMDIDFDGVEWTTYLKGLERRGYFKDEIKGSQMYRKLFESARDGFKRGFKKARTVATEDGDDDDMLPQAHIWDIYMNTDVQEYFEAHKKDTIDTLDAADSIDWLFMTGEEIEEQWESRMSGGAIPSTEEGLNKRNERSDRGDEISSIEPEAGIGSDDVLRGTRKGVDKNEDTELGSEIPAMIASLKQFVGQRSEFDGVVVPPSTAGDTTAENRADTGKDTRAKRRSPSEMVDTDDFDTRNFFKHIQSILGGFDLGEGDLDAEQLSGAFDVQKAADGLNDFLGSDTSVSDSDDEDIVDLNPKRAQQRTTMSASGNRVRFTEPEEVSDGDEMQAYYEDMQRELQSTKVNESFVLAKDVSQNNGQAAGIDQEKAHLHDENADETAQSSDATVSTEGDGLQEGLMVDVDVNLLKNILESIESQQGLSGPAGVLLESLGHKLPTNASEFDLD
ncbi:hypothetical protein SARC_11686 [Sphaeroforma arctica JP610]|uniref:SGT1-domain-containing protein n=1 Tax=Sphaeroforma arctica JP610 TaxID=667725 RepID=A0A0L0FIC9_9EUKA|nr:hypothetical protein SARC_11686 [Sphaeroforma arctica JP610]KNC75793.1 hypothetical protein SARC_11686 [Sphaeroforma arctica JP610]|eukprot:XP_014149695.1 hypothetical protein SARC_11686 [Sphaeroforma arctica JP610]